MTKKEKQLLAKQIADKIVNEIESNINYQIEQSSTEKLKELKSDLQQYIKQSKDRIKEYKEDLYSVLAIEEQGYLRALERILHELK